jgi:hypothetical protein
MAQIYRLFITFLLFLLTAPLFAQQILLEDPFGRNLKGETIQLVDWEGYMANPAIQLTLTPPATATFPFSVTITANHSRLYFDMPSTPSATGPSKTITFFSTIPREFFISIFPDRAGGNETYTLSLQSYLGTQTYPIAVLDQDVASPVIDFDIIFDYSTDTAYNFFQTAQRNIAEQAADDWAYFLEDMNFDQVAANSQFTYIWQNNYAGGSFTTNSRAYRGFYLYAYGLQVAPIISGGSPSFGNFQTINGVATQLRRSGTYNADPRGNYNTLGWNTTISDDTWYLGTNLTGFPNDLYSIAMHELGHALCFNTGYPVFNSYQTQGFINDPAVVAYHGSTIQVDGFSHLNNNGSLLVDRQSKKGMFGSEYDNEVPYGRWLITKLNLLVMDAIGYDVKRTSAFDTLDIPTPSLGVGSLNTAYQFLLQGTGGIPFYEFTVAAGSLPAGLSLNSFTGEISGTPTQAGTFNFTIQLRDPDGASFQKAFSLDVFSTLSVDITDFSGAYDPSTGNVVLDWQAEADADLQHFEVLHRGAQGQYIKVGTALSQERHFTHHYPAAGSNRYRLRRVNVDGSFIDGPETEVLVPEVLDQIGRIYPNPVQSDRLHIDYISTESHLLHIALADAQGRSMAETHEVTAPGKQTYHLDVANLKPGVYVLRFSAGGTVQVRKFVKQ